ncbi:hypothetical protein FB567DRAFT_634962 [Paraphoma chrysanthemicola]|uniref:Uncharacterized protein n=1 Tax=Paraphoma chrysanthemicola TaxID=798071 RepID=A0A8K0QSZ4_9PLEO|nr:hypothetical protein FB567DRAFT_634962 [Paraphoma chrysanthemicola]
MSFNPNAPFDEVELSALTRLWLDDAIPSWFVEIPRRYQGYFIHWADDPSLWIGSYLDSGRDLSEWEAMEAMDHHSVEIAAWASHGASKVKYPVLPIASFEPEEIIEDRQASDILNVDRPKLSFRRGDLRSMGNTGLKIPATVYAKKFTDDLGLCKDVFHGRPCPRKAFCPWRHHRITDAELVDPAFLSGMASFNRRHRETVYLVTRWDRDAAEEE